MLNRIIPAAGAGFAAVQAVRASVRTRPQRKILAPNESSVVYWQRRRLFGILNSFDENDSAD
jgi:hypothetical protein